MQWVPLTSDNCISILLSTEALSQTIISFKRDSYRYLRLSLFLIYSVGLKPATLLHHKLFQVFRKDFKRKSRAPILKNRYWWLLP